MDPRLTASEKEKLLRYILIQVSFSANMYQYPPSLVAASAVWCLIPTDPAPPEFFTAARWGQDYVEECAANLLALVTGEENVKLRKQLKLDKIPESLGLDPRKQNPLNYPPLTYLSRRIVLPLADLNTYTFIKRLGEGTYGQVSVYEKGGSTYAIKRMDLSEYQELNAVVLREVSVLRELIHPNVAKLLHVMVDGEKLAIYLVFELMSSDISSAVESTKSPDLKHVKKQFYQMASAIAYMHARGIMHRDLKPGNILQNADGSVIKIADFGLARRVSQGGMYTPGMITLWYRPPEMLSDEREYGLKVDVWSLGCILAEMFMHRPLFAQYEEDKMLKDIESLRFPDPTSQKTLNTKERLKKRVRLPNGSTLPDDAIDLLDKMLEIDPNKRISARDILLHPYFS